MTEGISRRALAAYAAGTAAGVALLGGVAEAAASTSDWLATIKAQHQEIDRRLGMVRSATSPAARRAAFKAFANYLSAHSLAEETSVYPAIAITGSTPDAQQLYHEQDDAEILVARIDNKLAKGQDAEVSALLDQLATALHAHVAEEETRKFPALRQSADAAMNAKITADFKATFARAVA